jgi:spore coat protein SA
VRANGLFSSTEFHLRRGCIFCWKLFEQLALHRPNVILEIIGPDKVIPLDSVTSLKDDLAISDLERFYRTNYPEQMRSRVPGTLQNRIIFVGPLLHSELSTRMRKADVLVQPSIFDEPFGMPIVEAMASGLPVVASSVGGIPELVADGHTGILVDRDNPAALADALNHLLDNPALARQMGHGGRLRAEERFSWERTTEELKLCYFGSSRWCDEPGGVDACDAHPQVT